jgi:signal transduction histidine kinase/ligand-binding sensor domain-containing protein/DNA-binding response OmpR family regulator
MRYTVQRYLYCVVLMFALLYFYTDARGQATDMRFKRINVAEGLSNSTIESIYQDSRGFMWFGTRDGLNRYDGYEMVTFKNELHKPNSISDNYIRCISEDAQHNLWVGTIDGLNKLNRETNSFTVYKHQRNNANSIAGNSINCIYNDKKGALWIGADSGGLNCYNIQNNTFTRFLTSTGKNNKGNTVNCIYEDTAGCFWLGTQDGLKVFDRKTLKTSEVAGTINGVKKSIKQPVNSIQQDRQGRLWLGIENGGILVYDRTIGNITIYKHQFKNANSLSNDQVKCLLADSHGKLWSGSINGGLELFDAVNKRFIHHQNQPEDAESLSQRTVSALFEDRQNNLWVGTHRGGINLYVPKANKFRTVRATAGKNSLSYNDVRAFFEDEQGTVWIGTDGGGLNAYYPASNTFKHFRYDAANSHTLASDAILDVMQDARKKFWISTWGGGLNKFDSKKGTFERFTNNPADPHSLSSNYVQKAYRDSKNNFWIATYYGGLNLFNLVKGGFNRITASPDGRTALKGNNIISLKEDHEQNLWIGTDDGGLNCFNLNSKQFKHYFTNGERFPDLRVLFVDHAGKLWLGQKGLYLLDRHADKFKLFTTTGGLASEFIKGIEEDKKGNLWISTSTGIAVLDPAKKTVKKYNIADGLQGPEFEANASVTTQNGTMYFGGINGFNVFNPDDIKANPFIPPIYITGLQLFNKPVVPGSPDKVLNHDISFTTSLKLNYQQSAISFQFAALNYNAPENNRYMYKMEGLDNNWYMASVDRKASFTNLNPGHYTFYVKGSNNDGIWNNRSTSISIVVSPPYWATWWFRALIISIVLYLAYSILKFKKNLDLKKIEERKKEEMHQMKLQFFTNISHDLRTPLSLIIGPLENLLKESPGEYFTNCYQMMYRNASRLMTLINELMDFRKVESGALKLKVLKGNINTFVEELTADFNDAAAQKAITLNFHSHLLQQDTWFDRQILEKVILNLINNAIKYTQTGGNVTVQLMDNFDLNNPSFQNELHIKYGLRGRRYCFISITDSGIGISRESLGHLFERYYRISESHLGSGIGLAFVKSLVTLHKGDIYVYSERQKGTEIVIALPCDEHDYTTDEKWSGSTLPSSIRLESTAFNQLSDPVVLHHDHLTSVEPHDKKYHILIVDDNQEIRSFLKSCLEQEYFIAEAADGAEGIAVTKEQHPDLIISDVMMPGTDGNEFCKTIRMDIETSHIPFIMLTAKHNLQAEIEGIESGADLYLAKPVSPRLLQTSLRNLFEQRQKLKERYSKSHDASVLELVHNQHDREFLNHLIATIEKELSNPDLDIDMLCKEVGMSRTKLYHKIKQISGQSPNEFIRSTRLKKAVTIMTSEDVLLTEVMYRVGIQTQSYFTKAFKKEFGETPSEFLQKHCKPIKK